MSPTFSHMKTPCKLNAISLIKFQFDRAYLNKEFYQYYNQPYRDWFFPHLSYEMQQLFKIIYCNHLAKIRENIPFFDWLNDHIKDTKISIPNYNSSICAIER